MKILESKTASVRLPKEMYEEIDNICADKGCIRNDWIKDTLREKLREESNSETKCQEPKEDPNPNRSQGKIISIDGIPMKEMPKAKVVRVLIK
ncbi:MAG: ribbon-helix-helix domain-containing protein [Nitrosopumilaceae archaeon]